MKVIFVIVSLAGGGAERVISILANQFAKKGIDVTVMMTAGDTVAYKLDERVQLYCIGGTSGGSMRLRLRRVKKMRDFFKANRDAVIISFGPGTSFFAVAAALFLGHRILISERNDPAVCPHKHLRNIVYGRADRLIFQTEDAKECFPAGIRKKGVVIPNPVSSGLPPLADGKREKTIVAVGRLEPQKNHKMLLKAFSLFHKKYPGYTLHLYGDGSLKNELETLAGELMIQDCVIFEGFVSNVTDQIKKAGIYALSSDYEGISNSLLEAMAMGLPSVSTDCPIGGSRLCIRSGENGILTPVGDAAAFAEALGQIASDEAFADKLSYQAGKIRENYSEENISCLWIELMGE